ncbi:MAG: adenylyltransferase [Actinobacteria bacterium]|nr:adenylyltransferase [Actinomycetota bacterium]
MDFTEEQLERYSRHIILKDVGGKGQEKILKSKVLIVGAGGLGSTAAIYLSAAGVGTLGIADGDRVDRTNLQRQVIHYTPDIGKLKVDSAKEKIALLNPNVKVCTYPERIFSKNAIDIIKEYDFVIDGTDNFSTKFLINDACVISEKPFSHGGILQFEGQTMTYIPGHGCYRCLFTGPPPQDLIPTCSQAGVLGSIAGLLGTIQATEALKYITGVGELLMDRILVFDVKIMEFRTVHFKLKKDCPACGSKNTTKELIDYEQTVCY